MTEFDRQNPDYGSYYSAPEPKQPQPKNSLATFSLMCGILGLLNLCCFAFTTSVLMGAGAVALALLSRKDEKEMNRTAATGVILGVTAIGFAVLEFFYTLWVLDFIRDPQYLPMINEMMQQVEQQMSQYMSQMAQ